MQVIHGQERMWKVAWIAIVVATLLALCPGTGSGQPRVPAAPFTGALPFMAGEALVYHVRLGKLASGSSTMWIDGPVDVRGEPTLHLRSHTEVKVGPFGGSGYTESWLDADRMASLRFEKEERRLLSRHRETVDVFPDEKRWTGADGRAGTSPTDAPLDELSFIYFLRTLPLAPDTALSFSRHFEAGRNPVVVTIVGRETITVPAGAFATVVVEMRVKDPRHYRGEGLIRIHLTDDACRIPVRIESTIPAVGRTVLTLERVVHPEVHCTEHGKRA